MKILVYGIGGTMGHYVFSSAQESNDIEIACGVDKFYEGTEFNCPIYKSCNQVTEKIDCIIDFSVPQGLYDYIPFAIKNNIPCVIATTGYTDKDLSYIKNASFSIPILHSSNMSLGVNLLLHLSKEAAKAIGADSDIEIIEQHHNKKKDAPSGTALLLSDEIKGVLPDHYNKLGRAGMGKREKNEIGIHAVRGGSIVGKHSVMFILNGEIITLTHEAENKNILSQGSLTAARFIVTKEKGLYSSTDMFR